MLTEVAATLVDPPMGAVDWPSISDCTEALKEPDMPDRLSSDELVKMRTLEEECNLRELGRERLCGVLRILSILEGERLKANEAG